MLVFLGKMVLYLEEIYGSINTNTSSIYVKNLLKEVSK